jgi:hypothetical protein
MRCPTKYLRGRISNYNNNNGSEVLERGQRVRLLSGEKGITIGKNKNFEFPLWEIKLENGKILTEARYRFDVLTEPEVSNDPGNSDSPRKPNKLMT